MTERRREADPTQDPGVNDATRDAAKTASSDESKEKLPSPWLAPYRWKPGTSGNPAGRPRESGSLAAALRRVGVKPAKTRMELTKVEWHWDQLFPRVGFIVTNMTGWSKKVVKFYNGRGTAEQWIREGKYAVKWTRLSCRNFKDNQARLQLFALAYNLGNFLRRLALPRSVKHWSLTTLREKLIKIGAKVVRHSKYVTFQMAEVAVPRELFAAILDRIQRFGVPPPLVQRG